MAIVYRATLDPTKPTLIAGWLSTQPWCRETSPSFDIVGAFRFDDPRGDVGIETHIVRGASGTIYQVPLSYRGAELPDAAGHLVTEMSHSVLGHRWVYDAVGDPAAVQALVTAITTGASQVDVFVDGERAALPVSVAVRGTGRETTAPDAPVTSVETRDGETRIRTDRFTVVVPRIVDGQRDDEWRLDAVADLGDTDWPDGAPATLAYVVQRP